MTLRFAEVDASGFPRGRIVDARQATVLDERGYENVSSFVIHRIETCLADNLKALISTRSWLRSKTSLSTSLIPVHQRLRFTPKSRNIRESFDLKEIIAAGWGKLRAA